MHKKIRERKTVLDAEEREIERAMEREEYAPVPNREREIERAQTIARNTFAKTKTINVRISERDLVRLRAKAHRDGVPYQTLISSLIRQATR